MRRFEADEVATPTARSVSRCRGSSEVITVAKVGIAAIQDLGRVGQLGSGISWNGAADGYAAKTANSLLGNRRNAGLIEITALPFRLVTSEDLYICVTGAPARVTVDGVSVPHWRVQRLAARSHLSVDTIRQGLRTYVAIGGGIAAAMTLGSCAPDFAVPIGRLLVKGDELTVGEASLEPPNLDALPASYIPTYGSPWTLNVCVGPDASLVEFGLDRLCDAEYQVRADSNLVGIRLDGPALADGQRPELLSRGVVVGAVEILPSGLPLILGRGNSITAGYPVVAVVARMDIDLLGQMRPGDAVRFRALDLDDAVRKGRSQSESYATYFRSRAG